MVCDKGQIGGTVRRTEGRDCDDGEGVPGKTKGLSLPYSKRRHGAHHVCVTQHGQRTLARREGSSKDNHQSCVSMKD